METWLYLHNVRTSVTLLEYTVPVSVVASAPFALLVMGVLAQVPSEGLSVDGQILKIASGTVLVAEAGSCTLVAEDGVVTNVDGLPSQPVEFGSFIFRMKDSVPPTIQAFLPSAGAGAVLLGTRLIRSFIVQPLMKHPEVVARQ